MVFAPFTSLDNHRKSVTFGCALMMKEDVESYTWVFEHFKKAMLVEPSVIVTDQDPAIRVAFDKAFTTARHRWCMWHIMDKVSKKISASKLKQLDYRKMLGQLVWNDSITPSEFEKGWSEFVHRYDEHDNSWYNDMYNLRSY